MKTLPLFLGAATALLRGCAESQPGTALRHGQPDGVANEPAAGMDSTVRYGAPSGKYARPSRATAVPTRASGSDVR